MRNPVYEQALNKQGLTWSYEESRRLDDIDEKKSLGNQARLEHRIDDDLVESYRQVYEADGSVFPPLVAYYPGVSTRPGPKPKLVLIDGNNRLAAARKAKRTTHDIYLVDCSDPRVIDRVTWTFNNLVNGKRLTPYESLEHASSYVRKYGMDVTTAAKEWGLTRTKLQRHLKLTELKETLERNKVKRTPLLSDDKLYSMSSLQQAGEDVLCAAAVVVGENGLTNQDIDTMLRDVAKAPTSQEKKAVIDRIAASEDAKRRRAETKGGTVNVKRNDPRDQLTSLITRGNRLFDKYERAALKPAPEDYKEQRVSAAALCHNLSLLFGFGSVVSDEDRGKSKGGVA